MDQNSTQDVQRRDDHQFQSDMEALLKEAEETRLQYMQQKRSRSFASMTFGILSILAGAGGFGWFLLVQADLVSAVLSILCAMIIPAALHFWSEQPIKDYVQAYKTNFMPKIAKALGGLKFHPARGISNKIISKTGVLPSYDDYIAEDCFMGKYKGVKVLMSEARLYNKKHSREPVFDGIFVLLEVPKNVFDGHTIITADHEKSKKWAGSRWQKLQKVSITTDNHDWNRFEIFSDAPDSASLLVGEKLLKELSETADIFDKASLTAVLFRGKYVFMCIPYEKDMFEASNIYVPITTKQHALHCKKEVEQILEIIDVFDLYEASKSSGTFTAL